MFLLIKEAIGPIVDNNVNFSTIHLHVGLSAIMLPKLFQIDFQKNKKIFSDYVISNNISNCDTFIKNNISFCEIYMYQTLILIFIKQKTKT